MNKLIEKALETFGCVTPESLAFQLGYLEMLKENDCLHLTLETGVFHGRTGVMPVELGAEHYGIDHTAIKESSEHFTVIRKNSRYISETDLAPFYGKVDFMLIDGEHSYEAVYNDLEIARKVLSDTGVLILDDTIYNFPGVRDALRDFLRDNPQTFYKLCEHTFETALCKSNKWEQYYNFTVFELPRKMVEYLPEPEYRINVGSGESDEQNNCFLNQPFIKISFVPTYQKKLEYVGNAFFNEQPHTFPIIERKVLSHLDIDLE